MEMHAALYPMNKRSKVTMDFHFVATIGHGKINRTMTVETYTMSQLLYQTRQYYVTL